MDKYKKRHNARIIAAQVLYISAIDPEALWHESLQTLSTLSTLKSPTGLVFDQEFAQKLIESALNNRDAFDRALSPFMKNGIKSIHVIERAILWIACSELNAIPMTANKSVILNESLNLIKELSDPSHVKFFNALLDRYASSLETAAPSLNASNDAFTRPAAPDVEE